MKVLVLGGTGAMGIHLVDIMAKMANVQTFVTTRRNRIGKGNVNYIQGNARDIHFLSSLLATTNFDVIVDFMVYRTSEFRERCNLLLASCGQYVFLSSARVFANEDKIITESSPRLLDVSKDTIYLKTDEYALSKAREENILRESGKANWTIVRPYITFSEVRLQLGVYEKENWLYRALQGRSIVFSRDISGHYTTMTYGGDVAQGIVGLIGNEKALGEDFNIATNENHTWKEILDIYLNVLERKLGVRPDVKYTDSAINLQFNRKQYQVKYCRLFDRRFDNRKILSTVPDLQFSNTIENIQSCLEMFLAKPYFNPITWGQEALLDKISKEYIHGGEILDRKQYFKYWLVRFSPWWLIKMHFSK